VSIHSGINKRRVTILADRETQKCSECVWCGNVDLCRIEGGEADAGVSRNKISEDLLRMGYFVFLLHCGRTGDTHVVEPL
ncbi:hypothetical protein PFISCL1PPCAC_26394, partial [Pristionchus fissidentatus]